MKYSGYWTLVYIMFVNIVATWRCAMDICGPHFANTRIAEIPRGISQGKQSRSLFFNIGVSSWIIGISNTNAPPVLKIFWFPRRRPKEKRTKERKKNTDSNRYRGRLSFRIAKDSYRQLRIFLLAIVAVMQDSWFERSMNDDFTIHLSLRYCECDCKNRLEISYRPCQMSHLSFLHTIWPKIVKSNFTSLLV